MFGFGFKSRVKKIVEEDLESFVTPMFAGRFSNVVSDGKAHNANEYSVAIEFVLQITEHLESVWSEDTGKVEKTEITESINNRCENIKKIMHLADVSQDEILNRVDKLIAKIN